MLKKLLFAKRFCNILNLCKRFSLLPQRLSAIMIVLSASFMAQTSIVIPNSNITSAVVGPFQYGATKHQFIIDDTQLTSLNGKYITSIAFRLSVYANAAWLPYNITFSDYKIYLSNAVNPANSQLILPNNIIGNQTLVRSGSLTVTAGSLTAGSVPNNFSYNLIFDTPYLYSGNNLLIEIQHSGSNVFAGTNVESIYTSEPGYGILYKSYLDTPNAPTAATNFPYIKINATDVLSVKSTAINNQVIIYPNPVKDDLLLENNSNILEIEVYTISGQLLKSVKVDDKKVKIDLRSFEKGIYFIHTVDDTGNSSESKIIKE